MNQLLTMKAAGLLFLTLFVVTATSKRSCAQPQKKVPKAAKIDSAQVSVRKADTMPVVPVKKDTTPLYVRKHLVFTATPDSVIEEKLVQLALQGPLFQTSDNQIKIAQYQLSKAKKSWLNLLSVSGNYNDQTFANHTTTAGQGAYIYPKFFFGITIPLGVIFSMGPDIKIGKEGVAVSRNNQEQLARTMRADILSKYKQYKTYDTLVAIQNDAAVDEQASLAQLERKAHTGAISIEQYNIAHKAYGDELARGLNLKLQRDLIKIEIERIIGTKLENVINYR